MPFVEIEAQAKGWVSIGPDTLTISQDLREEFFKDKRTRLFFDEERMLLGLQPSEEGYKLAKYGRIRCAKLSPLIKQGRYEAEWSDEHDMLIVNLKEIK